MKTCTVLIGHTVCKRKHKAHGLCQLHYQRRWKGVLKPSLLRSDNLRRVPLDDVAVNWLLGVFERLPRRAQ